MSSKFTFDLKSDEKRRAFPHKIIIGQKENESARHVLSKFLAYVIFFRERLQIDSRVPDDSIPFEPALVQLDYSLRPVFWVECGDCGVGKLHKLAVKAPDAEIWIIKRSLEEGEALRDAMAREELRQGRYGILAFDPAMFDELCGLLAPRNTLIWFRGELDPPQMQFEFNGLWFDTTFRVLRF